MKKFAQLTILITIVSLIQLGCDSVTDADIDSSNNSTSLNTEITHSSEGDDVDIVVDNDNSEWGWVLETGETGTGEFVAGPETPLIGSGSARFLLEDSEDGLALIGKLSDGAVPLADIDKLEYNTYQSVFGGEQAVALQLNVNYEGGQEWQGRLVFEPYHDGEVELNEWQTWNTLTQAGWWATGAPGNELCTQGEPCTLSDVLDEFPEAVVRAESELENASLIIFKAGSGWDTFEGNVDGFTISIAGEELVYSFEAEEDDENGGDEEDDTEEPGDDPLSIEDCKEGGWEEYGFRNQGQCIRYVNTGKDSREESQEDEENGEEEDGDNEEEPEEEDSEEGGEDATDPATIQDCQNGGWAEYGFRNQGQCIRYVNTGKDSRGESHDDDENGDESDDEDGSQNGNGSEDDENGEDGDSDNDEEESNGDNGNGTSDDDEEENGNGETTTAGAGPSSVEDCRDGGWEDYGFRNQGECVRTVRNGG